LACSNRQQIFAAGREAGLRIASTPKARRIWLRAGGALVPDHRQRQHAGMSLPRVETLAKLAEGLRDDEIHVWQLHYERQHGRAPLRRVLAAYVGAHIDDIVLTDGEYGRPSLEPSLAQSLGFNWSHSGNRALIAIGRDVTPGIDIERRRNRPRAQEIAQRYFTREESDALATLPVERRPAAFLELWTAKEAVLKAVGRGIAFGLDRLNIVGSSDDLALERLDGDDVGQWQLRRLSSEPDWVGALAWRGGPRRICQRLLAIDD
jgi:4'-phosphopantetheinyl transferase